MRHDGGPGKRRIRPDAPGATECRSMGSWYRSTVSDPATHGFPPLSEFMPHRAPMLLLDALVAHAPEEAVCVKTFGEDDLFVKDGVVSGFVALELFAQAAAAHFGYVGLTAGGKATSGALLGTRKIELSVPTFAVGEQLTIRVKQVMAMPPAAQFECTLHGPTGALLAEGVISVAVGVEAP